MSGLSPLDRFVLYALKSVPFGALIVSAALSQICAGFQWWALYCVITIVVALLDLMITAAAHMRPEGTRISTHDWLWSVVFYGTMLLLPLPLEVADIKAVAESVDGVFVDAFGDFLLWTVLCFFRFVFGLFFPWVCCNTIFAEGIDL